MTETIDQKNTLQHNTEQSDTEIKTDEKTNHENMPKPIDPTRFGDWEKNGKCCDF